MQVELSKRFVKEFNKIPANIQQAFRARLELFVQNRFHQLLHNHALSGPLTAFRSINITGDWRAIFSEYDNGEIIAFERIGTHSKLYGK